MHLNAALAGLALAVPALAQQKPVYKAGQLGFSLGAVLPGPNGEAISKTTQDYMDDFEAIKANTDARIVRLYSANENDQAENVLPAAEKMGFQVVLGVWVANASDPSIPTSPFNLGVAAIAKVAEKYQKTIYGVTIGSEGLYRANYTDANLASMISTAKNTDGLQSIKRFGTADTWNALSDGRGDAIIKSDDVNLILANAFAYWQNDGTYIGNASYCYHDDVQQSIAHIQQLRGSLGAIDFWTGETGWPTAGGGYGTESALQDPNPKNWHFSESSLDNSAAFWKNGTCTALDYGTNVFVFEAFDEPLKPQATGLNGQKLDETHWGVMDVERKPKFSLKC